jgi:hypothetical protein
MAARMRVGVFSIPAKNGTSISERQPRSRMRRKHSTMELVASNADGLGVTFQIEHTSRIFLKLRFCTQDMAAGRHVLYELWELFGDRPGFVHRPSAEYRSEAVVFCSEPGHFRRVLKSL